VKKGKIAAAVAATTVVLGTAGTASAAVPVSFNVVAQKNCSDEVCMGAQSYGGSGPDIQGVQIQTKGLFAMPIHSIVTVWYGSSCGEARLGTPFRAPYVVEARNVGSVNFPIYQTLRPGYYLCGTINCLPGMPEVRIGA